MKNIDAQIEKIVEKCIERWGVPDRNTENLQEKVCNWLEKASKEEKQILIKLLEEFDYYSRQKTLKIFSGLITKYKDTTLNDGYQIYTYIKSKNSTINSSINLLTEIYENIGGISKASVKDDISKPFEGKELVKEIVLIDDFIGTGDTIIRYMNDNLTHLQHKKIVVIVVEIAYEATERINDFGSDNELDIEIRYHSLQYKAFKQDYIFSNEELECSKKIIYNLEARLWGEDDKNVLGYEDSQCLLGFWRNTPNNTLSSFWYQKKGVWNGLFPRKKDTIPAFLRQARANKYRQRTMNYSIGVAIRSS